MATFVLVHGAWHGAWCWRRVARLLADFVAEVILEGRVGWIDDFLRSMQSQLSRQPHTERPF